MTVKDLAFKFFKNRYSKAQINLYMDNSAGLTAEAKRAVVAEYTKLVHESINNWESC